METHHKSFGAWIPAELLYNKEITPRQKLLYCTIFNLCNQKGYCWATNGYFANEFEVSHDSVGRDIKALREAGIINTEMIPNIKGTERRIRIEGGVRTSAEGGVRTSDLHKNININTNGKSKDLPSVQKVIDDNIKIIVKCPMTVGGKQINKDEVDTLVEMASEYNKTRSMFFRKEKLRPDGYEGSIAFDGKACRQVIELIRSGYTVEDFNDASSQAFVDQFHIDNKYKYVTPEYISRMGMFQKYLELFQSEMAA